MVVENPLSTESQQLLVKIARDAIKSHIGDKIPSKFQITDTALLQKRGAFVTLRKDGQLRGCIGHIVSDKPLYEIIAEVAAAAATRDTRFKCVTLQEMPAISIEISVLTLLRCLHQAEEIEIGVDGLYIAHDGQHGLLLPQVAAEHGWDRTQFLQQTCRKSGIPPDAWQDPQAQIYLFSSEVFQE